MKKGKVIEIGKMLSKEYFRIYLEDNNKDLEVLEDDIIIMGFKEFEEDNKYVMILSLPKLPDYYCEMTFNIDDKKLIKTNMLKRVIL